MVVVKERHDLKKKIVRMFQCLFIVLLGFDKLYTVTVVDCRH